MNKTMLEILGKKKYYYVQKCPECGSRVTGRYIPRPRYEVDAEYLMKNSLRHGELIRYSDGEILNNCYCEECGYEWRYEVIGRLISRERFEEEGRVRGTQEKLKEYYNEHPERKRGILKSAIRLLPRY
jgi:hypothetical protein